MPEVVSCLRVHMNSRRQVAAKKGIADEAIHKQAIIMPFTYLLPTSIA